MFKDYTIEEKMSLVRCIYRQIVAGATMPVVMSWGARDFRGIDFEGMVTLTFRVNGFRFNEWVLVSYNRGEDLYEIRLMKNHQVIKTITQVYCDQLGEIIDQEVERGGMTDEEYKNQVENFINSL